MCEIRPARVPEEAVESARGWQVSRLHAAMPLADHVAQVASGAELLHQRHLVSNQQWPAVLPLLLTPVLPALVYTPPAS